MSQNNDSSSNEDLFGHTIDDSSEDMSEDGSESDIMVEVSDSQRSESHINAFASGIEITSGATSRSAVKKRPKFKTPTIERKLDVIKWHKANGSNVS
jgi:hypothetical protein